MYMYVYLSHHILYLIPTNNNSITIKENTFSTFLIQVKRIFLHIFIFKPIHNEVNLLYEIG